MVTQKLITLLRASGSALARSHMVVRPLIDCLKLNNQTNNSMLVSGEWKPLRGIYYFGKVKPHLHWPEGAVQKDGPSAGITMATSLTLTELLDATIAIWSKISSLKI
jgi:ATP-dependent Lon protease